MQADDPFIGELLDDHQILRELFRDVRLIKQQVQITNGRVSRLENWRWFITGGLAVVAAIVVPLFVWVVQRA